jgi:hypothetical protein
MFNIASDPCQTLDKYNFDPERLALKWRDYVNKKNQKFLSGKKEPNRQDNIGGLEEKGMALIRTAVQKQCQYASYIYACDLLKSGKHSEGREILEKVACGSQTGKYRALALRALSINSERLGDCSLALEFTEKALKLENISKTARDDFTRRKERLLKKTTDYALNI